jgi:hypothetical protein
MEIELYSKLNNPIEAIDKLGEMFAKSGMFGCERIEQGKILAMACLTEHKSPIQIAREYNIIEGKLSDRADAMLAKFRARGGKYKVLHRTSELSSIEMAHEGQTLTFTLTWEDAQKEPFVHAKDGFKKNWRTPRARMQTMWARVVSDGVRTLAPEIVSGIFTPEEIEDEASIPTAGPAINLATPAPQPYPTTSIPIDFKSKVKPKPEAQVIDVETETAAEAAAGLAPAQPAQSNPEPEPEPTTPFTTDILPPETVAKIEEAIGAENAVNAHKYLLSQRWLTEGQTLENLTQGRANSIIGRSAAFRRAIANHAGGGK